MNRLFRLDLLSLCLAGLFCNPASAVAGSGIEIPVEKYVLDNGLDAGYAADLGLKLGTASFTLAMMDESTRSRSALEIEREAESLGAEITTSSDLDSSHVSLSALKENLEASIALFADIVKNPAFAPDEMERLRLRWLAGIEREKNQPVSLALRTLPPLLYGDGHAYGIPFTGTGTESSIRQLSRDELVQFHRDWIRPDNATLFVAGDTTLDEILPLLETAFGNWEAPQNPLPRKNIAEVELPERGRVIIIDRPEAPQSLILAAHVAPPTGVENNVDIEMMNDIIGGKYSARVNQNLRVDKHWSYGAFTFLQDARGQRPWIVYAPVQSDRTADAVGELLAEFNRFLGPKPATGGELTRVFRSNAFSLPGKYETTAAVLFALQSNERFGRPDDYVATLREKYRSVGLENIQGAAEKVIHPDSITWVIVGDRSRIEPGLAELGIAEPEFMDDAGKLIE